MKTLLIKHFGYYIIWYCAIAINTSILFYFFLLPRASFLLEHPGYSHKDIRMSRGTLDNKNFNALAFKLAYEIKNMTPKNSTIIFSNKEINLTEKVAMLQILFPREVYFEHEYEILPEAELADLGFLLTKKGFKENCKGNGQKIIRVLEDEWYLCHYVLPGP